MTDLLDLLEKRPVPIFVNGSHRFFYNMPDWGAGYNKSSCESALSSANDWDAVLDYLRIHRDTPNSYTAYSAALEKFILWLLVDKKKTLSDLKLKDFHDYFDFLKKPEPAYYWVGASSKKTSKNDSINNAWRPFLGKFNESFDPVNANEREFKKNLISYGLSAEAVRYHHTIIGSFFRFIFEKGHINSIPVAPLKKSRSDDHRQKENILERLLPAGAYDDLIDELNAQENACKKDSREHFSIIRNRFILKMFHSTGLRLNELANARFSDIKERPGNKFYELVVSGKGARRRNIRLYEDSLDAIKEFRGYFLHSNPFAPSASSRYSYYSGLMPSQRDINDHPIIPQIDLLKPVSDRRLDQLIKPVFNAVGDSYLELAKKYNPKSDEHIKLNNMAGRMFKASAHWMRHTHATLFTQQHRDDYKAISERLGHSDLKTTLIYVHVVQDYF